MEESHIALVSMKLGVDSFVSYRCDRAIPLGINVESLTKILKSANTSDTMTIRAEDDGDILGLVFESSDVPDRISEYNLKLMNIEQEHLSIPDTEYSATITMSASEYQRIIRDLSSLAEILTISVTKDGVRFSVEGDIGTGAVNLKPSTNLSENEQSVEIAVSEPATLGFNVKYLLHSCKAGSLSNRITIQMTNDIPALFSYKLPSGHLNYFMAPTINDSMEE